MYQRWTETQLLDAARFYASSTNEVTIFIASAFSGIPFATFARFLRSEKFKKIDPDLYMEASIKREANKHKGGRKPKSANPGYRFPAPFGVNGVC